MRSLRHSTSALAAGALGEMEYLWADGQWAALRTDLPLAALFDGPAVQETTLVWHAGLQLWYLMYFTFGSTQLLARTAPALEGPWSAPLAVYTLQPPYNAEGVFCYAVKAHPEWAHPEGTELVVSFVCNAPVAQMLRTLAIYLPVFLRIEVAVAVAPADHARAHAQPHEPIVSQ